MHQAQWKQLFALRLPAKSQPESCPRGQVPVPRLAIVGQNPLPEFFGGLERVLVDLAVFHDDADGFNAITNGCFEPLLVAANDSDVF